jgi:hypothetical protein
MGNGVVTVRQLTRDVSITRCRSRGRRN